MTYALLNFNGLVPLEYSKGYLRELPVGDIYNIVWLAHVSKLEEQCFPDLFPIGKNGFQEFRKRKLTMGDYFAYRILNEDNRFQKDLSYVFWCLNIYQTHLFTDKINYILREGNKFIGTNLCDVRTFKKFYPKVGRLHGVLVLLRE